MTAMHAEMMLGELGYVVCAVATSAPDAVDAAEREQPDLVMMDIRLAHNTNGINAAREIEQRLGIPSLFVSAHADAKARQQASDIDHLGFVTKPYDRCTLERALRDAIAWLREDAGD